jgi:hypothetical protein
MSYYVICYNGKGDINNIREITGKTEEEILNQIKKVNNENKYYILIRDENILKIIKYYEDFYNEEISEESQINILQNAIEDIKDIVDRIF